MSGALVISLDFEIYWGVRDHVPLDRYRGNLLGERQAIPAMLELFSKYGIHATWATVGFLFFGDKPSLLAGLPNRRPAYTERALDPYADLSRLGDDEATDPFHYGASLIRKIAAVPNQEIATHTFSHYYCLEPGQTESDFREDIQAARRAAGAHGFELKSVVFPRNQVNETYLRTCGEEGLSAYRGNPPSILHGATRGREPSLRRLARLADSYVNLTGHHAFTPSKQGTGLVNVPASRFLRPWSRRLRFAEPFRVRRILGDLTYAAERGLFYHLWWHPHNFGVNLDENIGTLDKILGHFSSLREAHGFQSLNMLEAARHEC
jgi:peptidoglycan/xylan/chitin deacetylase (PgdA/CDA1 family)